VFEKPVISNFLDHPVCRRYKSFSLWAFCQYQCGRYTTAHRRPFNSILWHI